MKLLKILILVALLGAAVLYYTTQLSTYKQSIEYYGGK